MSESAASVEQDWHAWVGRKETIRELIAPDRVAALGATLGIAGNHASGAPLPPGWHWIFFNRFVPRHELGTDGHPKRGGFLPPVSLPRRMWAGGRLTYHAPLTIGGEGVRESTILKVEAKSGRAGKLVFVTVSHSVTCNGTACITEEQDIVYREAAAPGSPAPPASPAPQDAAWSEEFRPDTVLLFRYSALTSNGHRIHYDQAYARAEENYPDLVVHGPLTATLLQGFAERRAGQPLKSFEFRGVSPLFVSSALKLEGKGDAQSLDLWASGANGALAMRAAAQV
ncbi:MULTISPECIES: FAS1-like dehydratase domain-containing protein [Bradyrhizobium]|uniref:FAS1-like dehydratase domain-containing protein n=1 Tax=Bradyrhizobium TaxID=374 RepID=UPI00040C8309|nr:MULTISPECIES: MaoC family dehydratase N-terminal domain-containing protein [Bradyrhizobium]QOG21999.1 acyl-CoA dehydrogenase [Bradyrhizobium sp. SEMIA]UFW48098.1 MaoC family dehydratase N-terminal domain-containing protein [Bradyrhizobium arachidis]